MKKYHIGIALVFLIVLSSVSINAGEALDLNGEWDATFVCSVSGTYKEIIKITQNADEFVGIKLSGDERLSSDAEEIKGRIKGININEIKINTKAGWVNGDTRVSEGGDRIEIKCELPGGMGTLDTTLLRKKK